MLGIKDLALWMYGDARKGNGFWYSHEIGETAGLTEEQFYWTPNPNGLCILWHVGHIAIESECISVDSYKGLRKQ
jgi:hypothetical protein